MATVQGRSDAPVVVEMAALEGPQGEPPRMFFPGQNGYNVGNVFFPRIISNCSGDCVTDVICTLVSGAGSAGLAIGALENPNSTIKAVCAAGAAALGFFTAAMIVYGITIRRCPGTQSFWNRVCCRWDLTQ